MLVSLTQDGGTAIYATVDRVQLTPHLPFLSEGVHNGLLTVRITGVKVLVRRAPAVQEAAAPDHGAGSASHRRSNPLNDDRMPDRRG